jgi:hypothetical protein
VFAVCRLCPFFFGNFCVLAQLTMLLPDAVRLAHTPECGRFLVAARDIAAGEIVLRSTACTAG